MKTYLELYDRKDAFDWYSSIDLAGTMEWKMTQNERAVVHWFYGIHGTEKKSARDIATILGVCTQRVYQIRNRALRRIQFRFDRAKAVADFTEQHQSKGEQ